MTTPDSDTSFKFNEALWQAQSKRLKQFNIAQADKLDDIDTYQTEIEERLTKLEDKFEALTEIIEKSGFVELPRLSLDQYLEDKTK